MSQVNLAHEKKDRFGEDRVSTRRLQHLLKSYDSGKSPFGLTSFDMAVID